jgi:alkanesulfonate monooxygenase SsuD/methylene tetrahydromethanopterin reductase-like flavin-dependent oxidoreductase (luciferase family)
MSGKLTFGYLYDFRNPPQWHRPWHRLYGEVLDAIAWSDGAGFSHASIPEHHMATDGYIPSPIVAMAAIAARTTTLRIASGIALAPLYNPVRFATDMFAMPPGLPVERFVHYAGIVASPVAPAFA